MPETSRDGRMFIWPRGSERVAEVKDAVMALDPGYAIKPFWYQAGESEGAERVIVLEDGFEHGPVVDYIYPRKPELVTEAVEWALGLRESHPGARLMQDTVNRIFGAHTEIWGDVHAGKGFED